jgi:hypothetical protein
LESFAIASILRDTSWDCRPMKVLLAALILACAGLVPDLTCAQVGGPPSVPAPWVRATSNFGGSHQVGDTVTWVVDVQAQPEVDTFDYMLIIQPPYGVSLSDPVVNCLSKPHCPVVTTALGGARTVIQIVRMPSAAHLTIVEHGTILAPGAFHVDIEETTSANGPGSQPSKVTTLSGFAAAACAAPSCGTSNTAPTNKTTTTTTTTTTTQKSVTTQHRDGAGRAPRVTPEPDVWAMSFVSPGGPYRLGENVTVTFTFTNAGGKATTVVLPGDQPQNLQVTGYRGDCPLPCRRIIDPDGSVTSIVDGRIIDGGAAAPPTAFGDTINYQAGGPHPPIGISKDIEQGWPLLVWLEIGGVAAAVVVVGVLGVSYARWHWWNNRISVHAAAHADEAAGKPDKIGEYVVAHVEGGAAGPLGAIPVTRIDPNG